MANPIRMLTRPKKRICPSRICITCKNHCRHREGDANGSNPSSTKKSASAIQSESTHWIDSGPPTLNDWPGFLSQPLGKP